jgi:glycosyltransferase involved in cell wall biosynthesis
MQSPLISCIVPVFNGERYLSEALDSILAQSYRPVEIIVVDDGSIDRTADVVARYSDKVQYCRQANAGVPAARNLGIRAAAGGFIAFLDADDLWQPEKLERQMACFKARPELDICVTWVQNFWGSQSDAQLNRSKHRTLVKPIPGYVTQALLTKRTTFDIVGLFDIRFGHAYKTDWFLRAAARGCAMELLTDVLVYRRLHPANMSRSFNAAVRDEYLNLLKANLDRRRSARSKL